MSTQNNTKKCITYLTGKAKEAMEAYKTKVLTEGSIAQEDNSIYCYFDNQNETLYVKKQGILNYVPSLASEGSEWIVSRTTNETGTKENPMMVFLEIKGNFYPLYYLDECLMVYERLNEPEIDDCLSDEPSTKAYKILHLCQRKMEELIKIF